MNFIEYMRRSETSGGQLGATEADGTFAGMMGTSEVTEADALKAPGAGVGYGNAQYRGSREQYKRDFDVARRLVESAMMGNRWSVLKLQEALTTSDFGVLFGDVLDRSVLANYAECPYSWSTYCKRATISDFRLAKIFRIDRGAAVLDGPLLPNSYGATGSGPTGLEQASEYPQRKRQATDYTDQLYKFGARMDFAWETLINDDLDALKDTPALFGRAARRTEEERATKLYCSTTGPNATFFSNANLNLVNATVLPTLNTTWGLPNNPPLTIDAIQAAMIIMMNQTDLDGEPISIEGFTLVVAPQNKVTAMNILNARELWANNNGGTYATPNSNSAISLQRLITENWAKGMCKLAVNYYLNRVITTGSRGATSWFLFADPDAGRPALQQSFLRGHEAPEMFMKSPNSIAIGEGRMGPGAGSMPGTMMANPMDGDFETDNIAYKIRHVIGGTLLDPIMAVASNGSGS